MHNLINEDNFLGVQNDEPKDYDESGEGFEDELENQNSQMAGMSKRTGSYTEDEDKLICEAWLKISEDSIHGAVQKGKVFWARVNAYINQYKNQPPYNITSVRNDNSIGHRWSHISQECSSSPPPTTVLSFELKVGLG
jgi:hypothetical protein